MSELNDLIYRNSKISFEQGRMAEQQRVIGILKSLPPLFHHNDFVLRAIAKAIVEIKTDTK